MKIIYEFDPYEDRVELENVQQAQKMYSLIWEFSHNVKRRAANLTGEKLEGYELAIEHFYQIAREIEVNLE